MGKETGIAWTDHTFNIAWGCMKVSPGCKNCYAETLSVRYGFSAFGPQGNRRTFGKKHWAEPLKWNAEAQASGVRRKVFCSSMCDVFEDHPIIRAELMRLWALIKITPWLDWQLLTKRPENVAGCLPGDWGVGYENVWLGTSIESQEYAFRADTLRGVPAQIRFISYEPAIGPLSIDLSGIHWLIYGGESGPGFRQEDKAWARSIMAQCRAQGTFFFHKQSSAPRTEMGIELDGKIIREFPVVEKAAC